jgi:hypothetical protein
MLRKMLIALTAVAAMGVGSTAMARGGHGGGHGGGGISAMHGGSMGPTMRGGSMGPTSGGGMGPTMRRSGMVTAPMVSGRVQGFNGRTLNRNNFAFNKGFRDHRHHRFHNRNFFAFGFAGPYFDDYGYDCWRLVQTYYGWQRVYVCGDYPNWGY